MIYTLTMNPALDYFVTVNNFTLGRTNRTEEELLLPGGKGLNVSIVLSNLDVKTTALGFVAGFVGEEIIRRMEAFGVHTEFHKVACGNSRINVKLKNINGTEINGAGPKLSNDDIDCLWDRLYKLTEGDTLVLAGSVPKSVSSDFYREIMEKLTTGEHAKKGIRFVVDATGELLKRVLPLQPFLVKPNEQELGELFEVTLTTKEEVIPYAKKLQDMGAKNVLVSLGSRGAVLVDENGAVYQSEAPEGTLVNAVGAGDSMVAGFLAGYEQKKDYEFAFRMGLAAGSASAFSEGLASKEEIECLL